MAGGLPYAVSLRDNLVKECWRRPEFLQRLLVAISVGAVTYVAESAEASSRIHSSVMTWSFRPNFTPRCTDGEVEAFELWPVERVMETLEAGASFKLNCNLVIIDFLIHRPHLP